MHHPSFQTYVHCAANCNPDFYACNRTSPPFIHRIRAVPSMCPMDASIPSSATCTRSSAVSAVRSAGRTSIATPMAGMGLMSAPTQKARSDGRPAGGASPRSRSRASIWPGSRSFSRASSIHRSIRLGPSDAVGSVNRLPLEIARPSADSSSPVTPSSAGRNFTRPSVHPCSTPSTSPSMTNRRPPVSSNFTPPSTNSGFSPISTSTPDLRNTRRPPLRRAVPSMPKRGSSASRRPRTNSMRTGLFTRSFST
mmetsp:Transcript_41480/g.125659  ORF Transcript_41480/g.125659 Transcript_41480/m.125659 type:complete len:252 (-) Transcript_41480:501-1256(-)